MGQDQKQALIIEAAIKRFAHFGVAKTTMSEIAGDLAISKASLYYYFPDKLNLYADVLRSIVEREQDDETIIAREKDPANAILAFLDRRTEFIIKYHNILEFLKSFTPSNIPKELEPVFTNLRLRELKRITAILDKGIKNRILKLAEPKKTAELFYDFLEAFRYAELGRTPNFFPDKKQLQAILKREKEFSIIFFKGLTL